MICFDGFDHTVNKSRLSAKALVKTLPISELDSSVAS